MNGTVTSFQNVLSDIGLELDRLREQVELYSDGDDLTDQDLTEAIAMWNGIRSYRKLLEAINSGKKHSHV